MNIDWNKPLETSTGLLVKYIRRRGEWNSSQAGRCQIPEAGELFNAGCSDNFPHVILIDGNKYETCREDGYTRCAEDFVKHGDGHLIRNVVTPVLDLSKPVKTRDGRPAKVLTTNAPGKYPVVGYIEFDNYDDSVSAKTWDKDGNFRSGRQSDYDLVNSPPAMVKRWLNLYRKSSSAMHTTEEAAVAAMKQACPSADYIKTIVVEIPEE